MADRESTVRSLRSSSRKKRTPLTQEEEDDSGFRFTRHSKRLRKHNEMATVDENKTISSEAMQVKVSQKSNKKSKNNISPVDSKGKSNKNKSTDSVQKLKKKEPTEDKEKFTESEPTDSVETSQEDIPAQQTLDTQKTKSKQRRRSSFIRGRKPRLSLELCESDELANVKGLHKDIPADLSSDKRLLLLFDKSLDVMAEKLRSENNANIPDFADKAEEFIGHLKETLQTSSLAKKCDDQQKKGSERLLIPNPKNEQLEKYAKDSQQITRRMLQEDKEWEKLLHKYQDGSESSERKAEDTKNNAVTLDSLSSDQQEFLGTALPLQDITKNLETLKAKSFLVIDKVCKTTQTLKIFNDVTRNHIEENIKSLGIVSFEGVAATPRQLIRGTLGDQSELSSNN